MKWSLDRAVTVGGFPTFQMGAGSLDQARAVRGRRRQHRPRRFPAQGPADHPRSRGDRALRSYNSELVKKNATEKDPWGLEYTKQNTAGSGAYKVDELDGRHRSHPGAQRQLEGRPAAEGQAHHLAHGAVRRQPARAARARRRRHLLRSAEQGFRRAARTPASSTSSRRRTRNGIQYIGMNVTKPPFDNLKVRQAVAYAIPYQKIMDAVLFGLAKPMFGAPADTPTEVAWPQPHKFNTDIAKAKQLLAEAGYPERLRDHALVRPGLRRRQRAALRADAGEPRADRHQGHDQQDPGRELAHRAEQEGAAALHQRVLGLARLSRVFLHLVLSRQEFDLQHDELPVEGHGRLHRRRRRPRRPTATRRPTRRT